MACMKDKDAWFIVECLSCPKVMECIKLDWTDDPEVKKGVISYLRELYGVIDPLPEVYRVMDKDDFEWQYPVN